MQIYAVQRGDTLWSIARRFGVSTALISAANGLQELPYLIPGQALVIPSPPRTYTVRPGDSLWSISRRFGTTVSAIAQANNISNPDNIAVGMVLTIPEDRGNYGYVEVNGYIEPSTRENEARIVNETGRYLTYISPFSYQARADGSLTPITDDAILNTARYYNVAPLMVVTNFANGNFDTELADAILTNDSVQQQLISNIAATMRNKGYYGINIDFERVTPANRELYNNFLRKLVAAMHPLGYVVSTALAPKTSDTQAGAWYGAHDYRAHGQIVDFVILMTYEWGWSGGPPYAVAPIDLVRDVIEYAVTRIPPQKILMGIPLYGYDWTLPYTPGGPFARRVSPQQALALAARHGAQISFDAQTQSPYFRYTAADGRGHIVWFEDARSIRAKFLLVNEFGLRGVSYWLLGLAFPQNWIILENMFNIVKVV